MILDRKCRTFVSRLVLYRQRILENLNLDALSEENLKDGCKCMISLRLKYGFQNPRDQHLCLSLESCSDNV